MQFSRRDTLQLAGAAGLAGLGATVFMPFTARAQGKGDSYKTDERRDRRQPGQPCELRDERAGAGDLRRPGGRQGAL